MKKSIVYLLMLLLGGWGVYELAKRAGDDPLQKSDEHAMNNEYKNQSDSFWQQHLKPEVYAICRARGTEPAGSGVYDKFYEKGIYYCACCGGDFPLFSSATKFDSGTGWPSFWAPISAQAVTLRADTRLAGIFTGARTEVLCARCDAHLGHVFDDGPKEHTGKRYCMNSLALSFTKDGETPKNQLQLATAKMQEAIFAMGCFWCGAAAFADHATNIKLPGVMSVRAGYTGGTSTTPTYEQHEGHLEAVKVIFNPEQITYTQLLNIFWHNVDPFDATGQFCDKGPTYVAAIFYKDAEQQKLAQQSKEEVEKKLGKPVVTALLPATTFYDAEEYHQDYKIKNPVRYNYYRWNCGRDARLKEIWG